MSNNIITEDSPTYRRISNGISVARILAMFWIVSVNYFQIIFAAFYNVEYGWAVEKAKNFIEVMNSNQWFVDKVYFIFSYAGWSGVVIFIIISGFSLWFLILNSKKFKIGDYILGRFNGIYIPYFIAVVVSVSGGYLIANAVPQLGDLSALFMGAAKFVPSAYRYNGPLWFISLIFLCYLFFPIIPLIYNKFRFRGILIFTIICSGLLFYLYNIPTARTSNVPVDSPPTGILPSLYPLFPFWAFMCIGVIIYHLLFKYLNFNLKNLNLKTINNFLFPSFVLIGIFLLFKYLYLDPSLNPEASWQINPYFVGLAGTLTFFSVGFLLPTKSYKILRWLSRGTLAVFLYHWPLHYLLTPHIKPEILTSHLLIAMSIIYFTMLICLSLFQSLLDKTIIKYSKNLSSKEYEITA